LSSNSLCHIPELQVKHGICCFEDLGSSKVQDFLVAHIPKPSLDLRPSNAPGWPNGGTCPLCRCQNETACHLLFKCRYSIRIWNMIKDWLGLVDFDTSCWVAFDDVEDWWTNIALTHGSRREATWLPSSCLLLGNFGKNGMQGPSTTLAPCPSTTDQHW
jgi:hypothetical protein